MVDDVLEGDLGWMYWGRYWDSRTGTIFYGILMEVAAAGDFGFAILYDGLRLEMLLYELFIAWILSLDCFILDLGLFLASKSDLLSFMDNLEMTSWV